MFPQLGKTGIVSARYSPAVEFALPAKGWLGGTLRGSAKGTRTFIGLLPLGAVAGAAGILFPPVLLLSAAILLAGSGYLIIGPFYGAAAAEAPATVEEAEAHLKAALASMHIQETMRDHVVEAAQSLVNEHLTVLAGQGPENSSNLLTYFPLQNTNVDSLLELRVNRLWLSANPTWLKAKPMDISQMLEINPSLSLGMEVRGRLIHTADQLVLYDNTWKYEGGSALFSEWAANEGKLFIEEFNQAYKDLACKVVKGIFSFTESSKSANMQ